MPQKRHHINPYPGIRSFNFEESHLFFGREKQIEDLKQILAENAFLAITGSSGSGKSSLVKAGLLPNLSNNGDIWIYETFRPANSPLKMLAEAVYKILDKASEGNNTQLSKTLIYNQLKEQPEQLVKEIAEKHTGKNLLFYIDQFEEVFHDKTKNTSDKNDETDAFIKALLAFAYQNGAKISTVISLRTDFLGDCSKYPALADKINKGHYLVPDMTQPEKERAIREPARYAGSDISDELMSVFKSDLKKNNAKLPVLQHALMRTWDYRTMKGELNGTVELEHYQAVGTISNALSVHAEEIFANIETERGRFIAEKLFKTLAHIGKENRMTRRPTTVREIAEIAECEIPELIEIIELFRAEKQSFLVPPPPAKLTADTVIDISHESILRVWKRMHEWLDQESKSAQMYLRISRSAALFQEGKTGLLTNPDLDLALKWQKDNKPTETWALRYEPAFDRAMSFLAQSKAEFDTAVKLKDEKQKRELKRTRTIAFMMAGATLISILFMIISLNMMFKAEASEKDAKEKQKIALQEKKIADAQKREAVSSKRISLQQREIADQQRILAEEQKIFAIKKQREALYQKQLADQAKNAALLAKELADKLKIQAIDLKDQAVAERETAEEQRKRAELSEAKTDTLRKLTIAKTLSTQAVKEFQNNQKAQSLTEYQKELPAILALQAYYFNKQYKGNPNDPDIYSALLQVSNSKFVLKTEQGHKDAVRTIITSKDGKITVSGDESGTVLRFKNSDFTKPYTLKKANLSSAGIRSLAINNSDKTIFAGNTKGQILIWKNQNISQAPEILKNGRNIINSLVFDDKNKKLIAGDADGILKVWSQNGSEFSAETVFTGKSRLISLTISQSKLYAAYESGKIIIFNRDNFKKTDEIDTGNKISATAAKNNRLIVAYSSGRLEIFENNISISKILAHNSGITDITFINNTKFATSSYDHTVKIRNSSNLSQSPVVLQDHTGWVYAVSTTDNGKKLISGSADKSLIITMIDIEEIKKELRRKVSGNMSKTDWDKFVGADIEYKQMLPND